MNYRPTSCRTAFISAVEELDPTLAVVLGRSRLGTKIKKIHGTRIALFQFNSRKESVSTTVLLPAPRSTDKF